MKICFVLLFFIFISLRGECQFPPAAGIEGTTAIYADSSVFADWATKCVVMRGYEDIAQPQNGFVSYGTDSLALGKADNEVVSLGDGGTAILSFAKPICNKEGFDFAVFENAFNDSFLELAWVEISSDSIHWFRFPSVSLTQTENQIGTFGSVDATKINNLAGKYKAMFGTPFDISDIPDQEYLNKSNIRFVKIIDMVGTIDSLYASYDSQGNIINDPYPTPFYSGGFDLDAVGVINSCPDNIEHITNAEFSIYPNPSSSYINITISPNYSSYTITLYSEIGNLILTVKNENKIDISQLERGLYFLKVELDNQIYISKIIKQ